MRDPNIVSLHYTLLAPETIIYENSPFVKVKNN